MLVGNIVIMSAGARKGRQEFEDGRWVGMQQEDHLRLSKHAAQVSLRKPYPSTCHQMMLLSNEEWLPGAARQSAEWPS